jgi:drug/metabolite transporter (DMT)-like permease
MVQFGMMYLAYIHSYQFLQAYEVALFTIFTPIYITLINDIISKKFNGLFFISASIAVIGAGIILYKNIDSLDFIIGFWLVQLSNLCFASGQVFYAKLVTKEGIKNNFSIFGLLYFGAAIVTFIPALFTTDSNNFSINKDQIFTLLYLGVVSSGLCFYLWNVGVTKTNKGILAIFNNAKIPGSICFHFYFW